MEVYFFFSDTVQHIYGLDPVTRVKVERMLEILKIYGNKISMPYSKMIDANLFELRTQGKKKMRILYSFHNDGVAVLDIFIKRSKKIPIHEIERARKRKKMLGIK